MNIESKKWFYILITVILITDLAIILNISFLRQIVGFLFLTLLPGLLILQILKLDKIEFTEKLVLTVGLSISFLMFFGLFINNLLPSLGYATPLSILPLLISFNIAFIVFTIIAYRTNKDKVFSLPKLNLSTSEKAFLIVPIIFPALSIFGTHIMKTADNNIVLMFMLFLIPIYVSFVCLFNQKFPKRLYPVAIFLISISLLLIFMLRFPHICGHDVHMEYGIYFQTTLDNSHWSIFRHSALDACLSISLLPTIFQSILNVNAQEYLFKGVYVSICSFGPLAIYVISKKYIGELYAFLASLFFISQSSFLSLAGSPRTNLAIFFVALALMVCFNDKVDPLKKRILFIVFMLSCVVSHYSTTYIFFFIMLGAFVGVEILSKKYTFKKLISLTFVILFFAFIFFWYSQVTETAFNAGVGFVEDTLSNLNRFFIEESRHESLKGLVGQELAYPILSRVNLAFTWATFILIGIGVLTMLRRYKEMVTISNVKLKKPGFLKTKFEMEYLVMTLGCAGLLVIMVALPYVSVGYGIQRLYSLVLIILSVCFVMGGMTLSHFLSKERTCAKKETLFAKQKAFTKNNSFFSQAFFLRKVVGKAFLSKKRFVLKEKNNVLQVRAYLIILLILIPYFLFQTGATYQICGAPIAYTLNSEGQGYDLEYVHDSESHAAKWLMVKGEKRSRIYTADWFGQRRLISQGKISPSRVDRYSFSEHKKLKEGYIYLCYNNVVNGKLAEKNELYNISEYSDTFIDKSKIYNNRGSEVWK